MKMSSLPLLLLLIIIIIIVISVTAAPTQRHNDPNHDIMYETKKLSKKFESTKELTETEKFNKSTIGGRMHKAFLLQKYISSLQPQQQLMSAMNEERTLRKRLQESKIFYIQLPATPYYFVPGLGYISNPPKFNAASLKPVKAHSTAMHSHKKNSFINLPVNFVSNGKPTGVYQFENTFNKPTKRLESSMTKLKKGPYGFNGKPSSLYLLSPDGVASMHQPIRYTNGRGNNLY